MQQHRHVQAGFVRAKPTRVRLCLCAACATGVMGHVRFPLPRADGGKAAAALRQAVGRANTVLYSLWRATLGLEEDISVVAAFKVCGGA